MKRRVTRSGLAYRVRRLKTGLELALGFRVLRARPGVVMARFAEGREWYQRRSFDFAIPEGASVLDIGCGPYPFSRATTVCDRFEGETVHRRGELTTDGKPLVIADVADLPFEDDEFDFVYCSHVLEHVDDPIASCAEIARVGKRGYIETPNFMKDVLFCQAEGMNHRWHTVAQGDSLFFFEYGERQQEGIRSSAWSDTIWSRFHHPLQDVVIDNTDLFNTMFLWEGDFTVVVVDRGGALRRREKGARAS